MEEISAINHIYLGLDSSKCFLFNALDSICSTDGSTNNETWNKINSRSRRDSLDYLKTHFKKDIPSSPVANLVVEDKLQSKIRKRKLFPLKSRLEINDKIFVHCLSPLLGQQFATVSKTNAVITWFSEKLVATNFASPAKSARLEISVESVIAYARSTFYRSRGKLTFDRNRITCQIYFKDWHMIEVSSHHVKHITVYSKCPFIKITVRTKIVEEISQLCVKYGPREDDIVKTKIKKPSSMNDVMLVFTKKQLSKTEFEQLVTLFGNDNMVWNESDTDTKDILENVLYKHSRLSDFRGNNCQPNWSVIFKQELKKPNSKAAAETTSSLSEIKTQLATSSIVNVHSFTNNCPTTSTSTKFDPIPNIFHKPRHESPTKKSSKLQQLATSNPNQNIEALNKCMNNGTKSSQSMINLPAIVIIDQAVIKPVQPTSLLYIPNRNIDNLFETFHYNPSSDSDVLIHGSDLICLNSGHLLNDNIINFYLNYIRYEIMNEDQRRRTHLFNVFFNTKLRGTSGNYTNDTAKSRHARVSKWTKKVNIFDKDFIIIPMNENKHWFVAIVCFPWMAGMISYDKLFCVVPLNSQSQIPINNTLFARRDRQNRIKHLQETYNVDPKPCILLFDSYHFQSRGSSVQLIREYLKTEWDSKRLATDGPLLFDKNTIRGFNPQVPQQTNNSDCGIFALHYVEQFFTQPLKVFTKEYFQSSLLSWFENETVTKKRAFIQKMVLSKADEHFAKCPSLAGGSDVSLHVFSNNDDSGSDIQIV